MAKEGLIKVPRGEECAISYSDCENTLRFVITRSARSDTFFLYEASPDGTLSKLGKSQSPLDLERKFEIRTKMLAKRGKT